MVDLFALGVVLFVLYSGTYPFDLATQGDKKYKLIASNKAKEFWETHQKGKPYGFFSDTFMDLIINMLQFNPGQRLTLADIFYHPWLQGPTSTQEEVNNYIAARQEVNKKIKEA